MLPRLIVTPLLASFLLSGQGPAQTGQSKDRPQPLYEITVLSRTTKAINYGHRTIPTQVGFQGTVLVPDAKGKATIEGERGATLVKAEFSRVPAPTRFGPQYLTYVVWAISPDGRPENLGELMLDGSNEAKLRATTSLQTFAMIVTAEPHFSVAQPSDAVIMENVLRPGTVGKVEEVNATYELLPRREFKYDLSAQPPAEQKPVSRNEYDAIVALYQAQNALQIAESQHADRYAPDQMARARQLYQSAKAYRTSLSKDLIAVARQATQVAEDARRIAVKRAAAEQQAAEQAADRTAQSQ